MNSLTPTTYVPNFSDPRVIKKAKDVLKWCDEIRLSKWAKTIHHDELRKVFGNTSQRGLAQWLFANLLSRSGHYQPRIKAFSYKLKRSGYEKVYSLLCEAPPSDLDLVLTKYGSLIDGSERITYVEKGSRRYHPIQNIKRAIKKQAFSGWWDYDIEGCAATLIHQYAVQQYRQVLGDAASDPFPAVAEIVRSKEEVRAHIAALTGLDQKGAKELVQMLLFRASCAPHHKSSVFRKLREDIETYHRFVNDSFVSALQAEVKLLWGWARMHDGRDYELLANSAGPTPRRFRKNSKVRMSLYLRLERRVIDAIFGDADSDGLGIVLMHDGFISRERVDVGALEEKVWAKTGFAIKLKESKLCEVAEDAELDPVEIVKDESDENDELDMQVEAACPL